MNRDQKRATKKLQDHCNEMQLEPLLLLLAKNGTLTKKQVKEINALRQTKQGALANIIIEELKSLEMKKEASQSMDQNQSKASSQQEIYEWKAQNGTLLEEFKEEINNSVTDPNYSKLCSYYATGATAFEEVMTKFFSKPYTETFAGWPLIEKDSKLGAVCYKFAATDEPYAVYSLRAVVNAPPELLFRDSVYNIEEQAMENPDMVSAKRVAWLGSRAAIVHTAMKAEGILTAPREVVTVNMWRKVNDTFVISRRSVLSAMVPIKRKIVRAYLHYSAMRYSPLVGNPNKTVFEEIIAGDAGGWLPAWLAENIVGQTYLAKNVAYARTVASRVVKEQMRNN